MQYMRVQSYVTGSPVHVAASRSICLQHALLQRKALCTNITPQQQHKHHVQMHPTSLLSLLGAQQTQALTLVLHPAPCSHPTHKMHGTGPRMTQTKVLLLILMSTLLLCEQMQRLLLQRGTMLLLQPVLRVSCKPSLPALVPGGWQAQVGQEQQQGELLQHDQAQLNHHPAASATACRASSGSSSSSAGCTLQVRWMSATWLQQATGRPLHSCHHQENPRGLGCWAQQQPHIQVNCQQQQRQQQQGQQQQEEQHSKTSDAAHCSHSHAYHSHLCHQQQQQQQVAVAAGPCKQPLGSLLQLLH